MSDKGPVGETYEGEPAEEPRSGRGSDDEYCSVCPLDWHHYIAHSVVAPPIRWVDRCQLCGHISSRSLRRQLSEGATDARTGVIF